MSAVNPFVSPEYLKQITFALDERDLVDFLIQSNQDGFIRYNLLKIVLKAYNENDPDIRAFVNKFRKKHKMADNNDFKKEQKQYKLRETFEKQMFFSEDEIDNIYDILETT